MLGRHDPGVKIVNSPSLFDNLTSIKACRSTRLPLSVWQSDFWLLLRHAGRLDSLSPFDNLTSVKAYRSTRGRVDSTHGLKSGEIGLQGARYFHEPEIVSTSTLTPEFFFYAGKRSFYAGKRSSVHTNTSRKLSFFKNAFQTEGIWKRRLVVSAWTKNIFKTELFENDDVTIITWFPFPRFS